MRNKKWIGMLCAAVLTCGMTVNAAPFDAAYYAAQNPDVVAAVGSDAAMLEMHYNTFGAAEGRMANAQDAVAKASKTNAVGIEAFDAAYYAAQNPDVAAIYGDDMLSLYTHYINFGVAEGRAPSAAAASAKKSDSASENPYARFATSGSSSKRHSKSSSSSSESESSSISSKSGSVSDNCVHELENWQYDDEAGWATCKLCGYVIRTYHMLETETKEATCTEAGETKQSCARCGWKKITPIPAVGHAWDATTGKCERCDEVCDHNGTEAGGTCDKCGYKVTE